MHTKNFFLIDELNRQKPFALENPSALEKTLASSYCQVPSTALGAVFLEPKGLLLPLIL